MDGVLSARIDEYDLMLAALHQVGLEGGAEVTLKKTQGFAVPVTRFVMPANFVLSRKRFRSNRAVCLYTVLDWFPKLYKIQLCACRRPRLLC